MKRLLVISLFLINCLLLVGLPTTTKQVCLFDSVYCSQLRSLPSPIPFDSTFSIPFAKYPKFKYLKPELSSSTENTLRVLWYDSNGGMSLLLLLYSKVNNLEQEGIKLVCLMRRNYKPFFRT
jgi:hypothetical protein